MSRPKKSLSQNFLSDPRILSRIADAIGAGEGDTVLEIGPGRGALTRELLKRVERADRVGRVIAIEKDRDLAAALNAAVSPLPSHGSRLTVIEGDALSLDWNSVAGTNIVICGNIPYHITSPLIDKALTPPRPRVVVFLVQKEVAERLAAVPGTGEYGALTIGVQAVAQVERLFVVPRGAFHPVPKVDSAVVRFTPLKLPLIEDAEVAGFRRFTVGMFSYRRKQLARGIRELTGFGAEQAARAITHALASMLLDARAPFGSESRPEQVAPIGMVSLFRAVVEAGWRAGRG